MQPHKIDFSVLRHGEPAILVDVDGRDATLEEVAAIVHALNGDILSGILAEALRETIKHKEEP